MTLVTKDGEKISTSLAALGQQASGWGAAAAAVQVFDEQGQLGTITQDGDGLTGSSPGIQELADSALRRNDGDAEAALSWLDGWSNGYVWAHA